MQKHSNLDSWTGKDASLIYRAKESQLGKPVPIRRRERHINTLFLRFIVHCVLMFSTCEATTPLRQLIPTFKYNAALQIREALTVSYFATQLILKITVFVFHHKTFPIEYSLDFKACTGLTLLNCSFYFS